ncbi:beta strand repeat-containing protein [Bradyrhizobium sp. TZ2]
MTRYKIDARTGTSSEPHAKANIARDLRTGAVVCRGDSSGWRAMLFGTVAAGALCIAAPRTATAGPDVCVVNGTVVTCSGNQSDGIEAGPAASTDFDPVPGTKLEVNNLTQDIVGSEHSGRAGIRWASVPGSGPINIVSNTGSFAIRAEREGMNLSEPDGITLNHTGNIFAGLSGIAAQSQGGPVSIAMKGNIVSDRTGISADSLVAAGVNGNAGAVSVNFAGNITSADERAIRADSAVLGGNGNSGVVTIASNGNFAGRISAQSRVQQGNGNSGAVDVSHKGSLSKGGINANSFVGGNGDSGSVIVSNTGDISSNRGGNLIGAQSRVAGVGNAADVSVTNVGNISGAASTRLISAISQATTDGDAGLVSVNSTGNLIGGIGSGGIGGIEAKSLAAGTGHAGKVVVINNGNVAAATLGILANSTATGTGNAGLAIIANIGNTSGLNAASRSASGNTGFAAVDNIGDVTSRTTGIFALAFASSSGNAATATVVSSGNIKSGDDGIMARSLSSTGTAADVNVASSGNIVSGINGIFAQSRGGAGQGNVQVTVSNGTVLGGSGAAVEIADGLTNLLTIGAGAVLSSLSGLAIAGGVGDEIVNNSGTVTGNVKLASGTNVFNNLAGAIFNAGSIVDLNVLNTGLLNNAGTFAPGGVGFAPITTAFTGKFDQGSSGIYAVDVANGTADKLNVSVGAVLNGSVLPTVKSLTSLSQQFTILSAAGGVTNAGIAVKDTAIFDYELLFPNANDIVLAVTANFTPTGAALTPNQRVTAAHIQSALGAGGGTLGGLFGYLGNFNDIASYATALDRLHAEPYLAPVKSVVLGSLGFTDSLMSCPTAASTGVNTYIAEGQCAWARMGGGC